MQISRRHLLGSAAALGAAAWTADAASPARSDPDDVLSHVDPELRPAARRILASAKGQPPFSIAQLVASRSTGAPPTPVLPNVRRYRVPGTAGGGDTPLYVVNARRGAARPAILHIHGGGFMLGGPLDAIPRLHRMAATLDCVVASVAYRLAPETPFPGALDDAYAALQWLHSEADGLGVDRRRLAVLGESAGGGLAALLALLVRDRGGPRLVLQALIYPMLDDRTGTTIHPRSPRGALAWTADVNSAGWRAFLGVQPGSPDVPAHSVPARRYNLTDLPPTFIGVGSLDLLVDEDVEYARHLVDADVATELLVVPGAFHAFDVISPESGLARSFVSAKLDAFHRAFHRG